MDDNNPYTHLAVKDKRILELEIQVAELNIEVEECDALLLKLADILTRTANVLKGEPSRLQMHSWHDLPEVAQSWVD